MTTQDRALVLTCVSLCAVDGVKLLGILISVTIVTHASCFNLPLEAMVLSDETIHG